MGLTAKTVASAYSTVEATVDWMKNEQRYSQV